MSKERINELLAALAKEISETQDIPENIEVSSKQLATDIEEALSSQSDEANPTILEDAIALEASFAVNHPIAEKLIRELVNQLSRLGI